VKPINLTIDTHACLTNKMVLARGSHASNEHHGRLQTGRGLKDDVQGVSRESAPFSARIVDKGSP